MPASVVLAVVSKLTIPRMRIRPPARLPVILTYRQRFRRPTDEMTREAPAAATLPGAVELPRPIFGP